MKKAGSETPVNIGSEISEAGVVGHHENQEMEKIEKSHDGLLVPSKASVPAQTEHQGLVTLQETKALEKPLGKPMSDSSWGITIMARKIKEKLALKKKGELLNAA